MIVTFDFFIIFMYKNAMKYNPGYYGANSEWIEANMRVGNVFVEFYNTLFSSNGSFTSIWRFFFMEQRVKLQNQ